MQDEKNTETPPVVSRSFLDKFLGLLGIIIPKESGGAKLHIQGRFFKLLGLLALLIIISMVGLFRYSTSPSFCNSCHIMTPYYNAWASSRHSFVPCVDCHYPPDTKGELWQKFQATAQVVKYVTRTYGSKPYAEIEDVSCLRGGCHDKRLLEGKVTFKRGIVFDHKPHLIKQRRGKQLRCTSCHSQIVVGNHIEVTENTCFLCHFKGMVSGREENPLGGCPSCHEPPNYDIKFENITFNHINFTGKRGVACQKCHLDAIQGDGQAPKERCFSCHNDPQRISSYDDTTFMHEMHVSLRNVECARCHVEIKHSVRTTVEPLQYSCDICHTSKHLGQKEIYMGIGGRGVTSMPSPMFIAQVDCIGCHLVPENISIKAEFSGQTYKATEAGCISCHGNDYLGLLEIWKADLQTKLDELRPQLGDILKLLDAYSSKRDKNYVNAYKLYTDARYNYNFVNYAKGVHNVDYAETLLNKSIQNLKDAKALLALQVSIRKEEN